MKVISDEYARIGALLRRARDARKMRQADIARSMGKTDSNIGQVEKGQTRYSLDRLREHARLVGADVEVLVSTKLDRDQQPELEYLIIQAARLLRKLPAHQVRTVIGMMVLWNAGLPEDERVDLPSPADLSQNSSLTSRRAQR